MNVTVSELKKDFINLGLLNRLLRRVSVITSLKSNLNGKGLIAQIQSLPVTVDGTGVLMCYGQGKGLPGLFGEAIGEISRLRNQEPLHLMINKIPPGIKVCDHRDFLPPTKHQVKPILERWHLPIVTNPGCYWWDEENGNLLMKVGFWWGPVPYWKMHNIVNEGKEERIHLVVDLDTPNPIGAYDD